MSINTPEDRSLGKHKAITNLLFFTGRKTPCGNSTGKHLRRRSALLCEKARCGPKVFFSPIDKDMSVTFYYYLFKEGKK